ncbi:isochorismatase family protein [Candidatus Latescibacterota bacterium]
MFSSPRLLGIVFVAIYCAVLPSVTGGEDADSSPVIYRHSLTLIENPLPVLADYPHYIEPLNSDTRYLAPAVINDDNGTLMVRSWRYSYAARGIIEMDNRLDPKSTALVNVHPWGCDDGHGLKTPEPNGVVLFCTPEKNNIGYKHTMEVINPFLKELRPHIGVVAHSLPGIEDSIRKKLYPSISTLNKETDVVEGELQLTGLLDAFPFRGQPLIPEVQLNRLLPVPDYFRQTVSIDAGDYYNGPGFWDLPIPLLKGLDFGAGDVVVYDDEGYDKVRDYLKGLGIRHILMTGHLTDVCVTHTTCGFLAMSKDFNTFLVGDATLAAFPASSTPRYAAQAALADASLNQMITQISWIRLDEAGGGR